MSAIGGSDESLRSDERTTTDRVHIHSPSDEPAVLEPLPKRRESVRRSATFLALRRLLALPFPATAAAPPLHGDLQFLHLLGAHCAEVRDDVLLEDITLVVIPCSAHCLLL